MIRLLLVLIMAVSFVVGLPQLGVGLVMLRAVMVSLREVHPAGDVGVDTNARA